MVDVEEDVEEDVEPAEEGTTWRKFVEGLLTLLLDMESRVDGLRNCGQKTKSQV